MTVDFEFSVVQSKRKRGDGRKRKAHMKQKKIISFDALDDPVSLDRSSITSMVEDPCNLTSTESTGDEWFVFKKKDSFVDEQNNFFNDSSIIPVVKRHKKNEDESTDVMKATQKLIETSVEQPVKQPLAAVVTAVNVDSDEYIGEELVGEQAKLFSTLCKTLDDQLAKVKREYCGVQRSFYFLVQESFLSMKKDFVQFLLSNDPQKFHDTCLNPKNEKMRENIASLQTTLEALRREEKEWDAQVQSLEQKALDITNTNTAITMPLIDTEKIDLKDEEEISQTMKICASQDALLVRIDEEFTSNVGQMLSSCESIQRLVKKARKETDELFDTFHAHEFQGYENLHQPKNAIRGLLLRT